MTRRAPGTVRRAAALPDVSPRRRRLRAAACSVAALLATAVYLNALHNQFVYDDNRVIVENAALQRLLSLKALVLQDISRPMVNVSYAIDRAIWGPEPFGFHLTNLLLHALNVVFVFQLTCGLLEDWIRRRNAIGERRPDAGVAGMAAAAMFAVHPMMTEAVGYVTGRTDLLCTAFFLAACVSARRWLKGAGPAWLALTVTTWIAALLSKETAAVLPLVLIAYDRLILAGDAQHRRRSWVWLHAPLLTTTLVACLVRLYVLVFLEFHGEAIVQWPFALVELDVARRYVELMLIPTGQSIFHEVFLPSPVAVAVSLTVVVGGLVGVGWLLRRRQPLVTFGFFWFLLCLVPVAVLVVMKHAEPMAERRTYLASCGLFLAAGVGVATMASRVRRQHTVLRSALAAIFAVYLFALARATVQRNVVWRSPVALWQEATALAPEHFMPHLLLAEALHGTARHGEAVQEYQRALTLEPNAPFAYEKLALCFVELGRFDDAAATLGKLRDVDPSSKDVTAGLGAIALAAGQPDEAKKYSAQALREDPLSVPARLTLALLAETQTKNWAEALRLCEEVQRLAPQTAGNDDCIRRNQERLARK